MGEPLRKLEIDGGDFDRNNEDPMQVCVHQAHREKGGSFNAG